ncbi:hypothetical protein T4A_13885 [Trichinella pseudospiralis]|uniref:Uncharacterized protein n=1 Tax=Trichinella pseudospiralis TaxID=6337 RepID=A0A0V1FJT3_TRIPS|nr:hypothetical protein T4A_13885 [Trichinella pseudospiralis]KRY85539.1 hypothetical protein T4D_3384 [Trichinella pseudospiralis]
MNQGKKSERELKKTSGQMMPNEEEELLCTTNWRVKTVEALALEKSATAVCSATVDKQPHHIHKYMQSSLVAISWEIGQNWPEGGKLPAA